MIRAFCAIPVPPEIAAALAPIQARLPGGRPVAEEALHITLAFFGEHQSPVIEDLHYQLEDIQAAPITLALSGLGQFGSASPRLIYAAVRPEPRLKALRDRVRRAADDAGIRLAREQFVPHVTLMRFSKSGLSGEEMVQLSAALAAHAGLALGPWEAEAFILYRSRLGRSGAAYEPLAEYPLSRS